MRSLEEIRGKLCEQYGTDDPRKINDLIVERRHANAARVCEWLEGIDKASEALKHASNPPTLGR